MAYPVSYRRSASGAGGFRPGAGRKSGKSGFKMPKPSNDNWRPPANDNFRRAPRIPRGAGAALKAAGRLSPLYRAYQAFKTFQQLSQLLGEVPAGYEVPGDWTLCNAHSACSVVPDGHYWMSGFACSTASSACLAGQATLAALPGTTPSAPPSTNRDQKIVFVRKTNGDWGTSAFRCVWTRMFVRPTQPASPNEPAPYYRQAQDPIYWPETYPDGQVMLDPEAQPIGQTVPAPKALPWALAAQRQPNPWKSAAYQSQWGYGAKSRPSVQDVSVGRVISVDPSGRVSVKPTSRPHLRVRPARSRTTYERKVFLRARGKVGKLYFVSNMALGAVTEALDFLGILYDLVPQEAKTAYVRRHVVKGTKLDVYDIAAMVALNIDKIDVAQAIVDYGKMQLSDMAWAKFGQAYARATPIGTTGPFDSPADFVGLDPVKNLDIKEVNRIPSDWAARYDSVEAALVSQIRRVL